ncbi:MAG: hypothetical protein COA50_10675 [Flavobacteriaceae bacterium]|nr:MAG: hypothetical protein COA50_10675 [Flavobacteriaceae bacterium]
MKDNIDQHLDKLMGKVMSETSLESPSLDFTANIMSNIEVVSKSEVTKYNPLISKYMWFFIIMVSLAFMVYVVFGLPFEETGRFSSLKLNDVTTFELPSFELPSFELPKVFSSITISNTFMYSIVIFAVLLFVQIPLLKKQFDKQFEY